MRTRHKCGWLPVVLGLLAAPAARAAYIDHSFDAAPFTLGTPFTAAVEGWLASSPGVIVTNGKSSSGSQSVWLPEGSSISNAVATNGPDAVWTDLQIAPVLGLEPDRSLTNGASFLAYFDTNGYLAVWTGTGWSVCHTDVWGDPVPPATNGLFAELSVYHDFVRQTLAVLLNDRVVRQDLPFPCTAADYGVLGIRNVSSNAWLDDAYVQATYATNRLTSDRNGVDGTDAWELQTYGYVARTFRVGAGQPYVTLAEALAVARDRDTLSVDCGTLYAETVTITQSLTFAGCAFTNSGLITVAAGRTVTIAAGFSGNLAVSGTVVLAQGVAVSGATVTVAGSITVPTNNAQLLAGSLAITGGGTVVASGGRVADAGSGVDMTGTFTLDAATWGTQAASPLNFLDDFEIYADGTRVQALGFRGWGASSTNVTVSASQGFGASKGIRLTADDQVSNRVAAAYTRVWTDLRLRPVPGLENPGLTTNATALLCYVGQDGLLNVWATGAWHVCATDIMGSNLPAMTTGAYSRVTAYLDFDTAEGAVFVDGRLALEGVVFPSGAPIPRCTSLGAWNMCDLAYLDDVRITTNRPADMPADLDRDGIPDVLEIERYGTLAAMPMGTHFLFH